MHNRTTPHQDVNKTRQFMCSQGTRSIESIPPSQAAVEQHIKRATGISSVSSLGSNISLLSRNFLVQQTGDGIYRQTDGNRLGQPYLRFQKRAMSSSDVAVSGHVGDFASAPRQTCLALRCALAMVIAIKIKKKKTFVG